MLKPTAGSVRIKLWDLPVRLVHWTFVLLLPLLWWTAEEGKVDTHKTLGLIMLALVAFRLLWGVFGSSTARFSSFVRGPRAVIGFVRGRASPDGEPFVGHNPLGALSILLVLALLAAQVIIGLFAQDVDGIESGPLSYLVSYDTADAARELHELGFNLIVGVVVLHVAAILFYLWVKKDNLVRPMVTGSRELPASVAAPIMAPLWRAIVCAGLAGALAWWVSLGCPLPGSG
ncbi:MAG: cytochrome b/b6 domain-containing protein [Novosphingobium sp.]